MKNLGVISLAGLLLSVGLFFFGRWTAPKPEVSRQSEIDSLTMMVKDANVKAEIAFEQMTEYKALADESFNSAIKSEKSKEIYKRKYENSIRVNHSYTPDERDSVLWSRYKDRLAEGDGLHP